MGGLLIAASVLLAVATVIVVAQILLTGLPP
jgi:hypothetical protein